MTLREILSGKGRQVYSIAPEASLEQVAIELVRQNCGSLVVLAEGRLAGIITERDILRACAARQAPLAELRVADHMSSPVLTASPDDTVDDTMGLLTERRFRHLPVEEDGRLVGMISIGDVVKAQSDRLSVENHYLKAYIQS